jgi:hypothetical protein
MIPDSRNLKSTNIFQFCCRILAKYYFSSSHNLKGVFRQRNILNRELQLQAQNLKNNFINFFTTSAGKGAKNYDEQVLPHFEQNITTTF